MIFYVWIYKISLFSTLRFHVGLNLKWVPWLPKSQKPPYQTPSKSSSSSNIHRARQVLGLYYLAALLTNTKTSMRREGPSKIFPDLSTVRFYTPGAAVHPACQSSHSHLPHSQDEGHSAHLNHVINTQLFGISLTSCAEGSGQHSEGPLTSNYEKSTPFVQGKPPCPLISTYQKSVLCTPVENGKLLQTIWKQSDNGIRRPKK